MRIDAQETAGTLHDRMAVAGAELIVRTLADIEAGRAVETPQAEDGVTYAKKIRPQHARLDWAKAGPVLDGKIRGMSPFPGAWFELPTEKGPVRVKALLSAFEDATGAPGDDPGRPPAGGDRRGRGAAAAVQREGRGPQDAETFLRGTPVPAGTRLG